MARIALTTNNGRFSVFTTCCIMDSRLGHTAGADQKQEGCTMFGKLWSEFKAFAFKGNMLELAVAVVIGAAFGNVIQSMVKDIINPAIAYAVQGVREVRDTATEAAHTVVAKTGIASTSPATQPTTAPAIITPPVTPIAATASPAGVAAAPPAPAKPADPTKAVNFDWHIGNFLIGDFIGAIINFMIQAFAVFILIVKLSDSVMKRVGSTPAPSEPTTKECPECLSVIPLKARRCPNCTSVLAPA
jgi:large conductance mechanosensitive channel